VVPVFTLSSISTPGQSQPMSISFNKSIVFIPIAGLTTRVIKNTRHHLVMEKPGKYNRIVLDFLQKN
jgi:pimeloyl-ACP methyl ester carboxylesterase